MGGLLLMPEHRITPSVLHRLGITFTVRAKPTIWGDLCWEVGVQGGEKKSGVYLCRDVDELRLVFEDATNPPQTEEAQEDEPF